MGFVTSVELMCSSFQVKVGVFGTWDALCDNERSHKTTEAQYRGLTSDASEGEKCGRVGHQVADSKGSSITTNLFID